MKKTLLLILVFSCTFTLTFFSLKPKEIPTISSLPEISKLRVLKAKRLLELYSGDKVIKTYTISLGRNPIGRKQQEGDAKTPEGNYYITHHNPQSSYHLSLGISYPNSQDLENAQKLGVSAGGNIMIHGQPNFAPFFGYFNRMIDWTQGCIAVTNSDIEEIYAAVKDNTPIEILP